MLLRAYGRERYSQLIQQNIDQNNYLAELIRKEPELEITTLVASNIVCFRYKPKRLNEVGLEKLNKMILVALRQISFVIITDTIMKEKYMLRACCVNHRSKKHDFDFLFNEVRKAGEKFTPHIQST